MNDLANTPQPDHREHPQPRFQVEPDRKEEPVRIEGPPAPGRLGVDNPMYQVAQDLFPGAFFPTVYRLGVGWRAGGAHPVNRGKRLSRRGFGG